MSAWRMGESICSKTLIHLAFWRKEGAWNWLGLEFLNKAWNLGLEFLNKAWNPNNSQPNLDEAIIRYHYSGSFIKFR